jgi:hypothetical protein
MWFGIVGSLFMVYAGLLSALRKVPSWWWIGPRKTWLRGHIWLGLLSWPLILFHSGLRWGGPLEIALWVVLTATVASGIVGLALQQFLPRLLITRVPAEAPFDQIPHLCASLRRKADALIAEVCGPPGDDDARASLRAFYESEVRRFLAAPYRSSSLLADALRSEAAFAEYRALPGLVEARGRLEALESLCGERRQLGEQETLYRMLHGWLLVHIPLSVMLLVLGVVHVVASLSY